VVKVVPINQEMVLLVHGANAHKLMGRMSLLFVAMVSIQKFPETRSQQFAKLMVVILMK